MVNIEEYSKYLKARKKAPPKRINRYCNDILRFEQFISSKNKNLDSTITTDVIDFVESLEKAKKGSSIPCVWGLATYFEYLNRYDLMAKAAELMWEYVKNPLELSKIEGVSNLILWKILQFGITNVRILHKRGRTRKQREELVLKTGLPYEQITLLVELAELSRLPNLKKRRVKLYHDAGFTNLEKIANSTVDEIIEKTTKIIQERELEVFPPESKMAEIDIKLAKFLEKLIEY